MAKIGVVGAGSWGIALTALLVNNGHQVIVKPSRREKYEALVQNREIRELPGVKIAESVEITQEWKKVVEGQDVILLSVASSFTRHTAHMLREWIKPDQKIVNVSKGIEENTLMELSEVIREELPGADVSVLSGPSHAEEVGRGVPTTCVIGSHSRKSAEYLQNIFMSPVFRVYTSPDVLGIEIGAALKNVIALAAGMADGLGYGDNTKAALITRGITEIARLGMKMGGKLETFCGLSGIGDLIVTCASMHSRNRRAGILIGQGKTMHEAMEEVQMVVEGVFSAKAALALARKYQVEMPIIEQVNQVLFEEKPAAEAVKDLMLRDKTTEHFSLSWEEG